MKKTLATFALLLMLSFSVFAEGDIHTGGRAASGQAPETKDATVLQEENSLAEFFAEIFSRLFR